MTTVSTAPLWSPLSSPLSPGTTGTLTQLMTLEKENTGCLGFLEENKHLCLKSRKLFFSGGMTGTY
jgi:hypothetical protein